MICTDILEFVRFFASNIDTSDKYMFLFPSRKKNTVKNFLLCRIMITVSECPVSQASKSH